ncbi:antitoxin MazE7 [Streptomyces sp. NPDC008121]|uniref:antitoxin MazE7 n=1 Tax=Streptomyces sp. NPDC008121 TaxID=3364809 RepID=UPI0036E9774B
MADIEIRETTKDVLQSLADEAGLSLDDYLARVAAEKKRERVLEAGAEAFRRVINDPATVAAFDGEFGGHAPAGQASRAA